MTDEFEPRRAEPGQEFSYTTDERKPLPEGEELPEGAELAVEHPDADDPDGIVKRFAIRRGVTRTISAGEDGVVYPKSAEDVAALDLFSLPVARSVIAEKKKSEAPAKPADGKE